MHVIACWTKLQPLSSLKEETGLNKLYSIQKLNIKMTTYWYVKSLHNNKL